MNDLLKWKYRTLSPQEMVDEADRLYRLQVEERGVVKGTGMDGKPVTKPGPYVATPERERRARDILDLRRTAARAMYPTKREQERLAA